MSLLSNFLPSLVSACWIPAATAPSSAPGALVWVGNRQERNHPRISTCMPREGAGGLPGCAARAGVRPGCRIAEATGAGAEGLQLESPASGARAGGRTARGLGWLEQSQGWGERRWRRHGSSLWGLEDRKSGLAPESSREPRSALEQGTPWHLGVKTKGPQTLQPWQAARRKWHLAYCPGRSQVLSGGMGVKTATPPSPCFALLSEVTLNQFSLFFF